MNRTKHTYTITDVVWIVIDLMFNFDISLFMLKYVDYYYNLLIVFVSLFIFNVLTHICHCYVSGLKKLLGVITE